MKNALLQKRKTAVLTVSIWCLLLTVLPVAASSDIAETILVPSEIGTIQEAIDIAVDSDIILIADGHYYERVNYRGKALTVASWFFIDGDSAHILATIIDGDPDSLGPADTGSVVRFVGGEGTGSVLCGLTIQNGSGTHRTGTGGVFYNGGGILCSASSPTIRDCIIRQNLVTGSGGGMFCDSNSAPTIISCRFEENQCGMLAGGLEAIQSSPTITDCVFSHNVAAPPFGLVGGCDFSNSTPILSNCRFIGNSSGLVIGGVCCYASPAILDHCVFVGNQAMFAGAFFCYSTPPTLTNCTFAFNRAPNGAGIYSELCPFILENSIVAFNQQGAGIVAMFDSIPDITCSDIYGNSGGDWTGTIASQANQNGNFSADPLFCAALDGDFHIDSLSPCALGNNDCASLIGALEAACSGTLRAAVLPDTLHAFDANSVDPTHVTVLVGNFTAGYDVENVDLASLRVNDSLAPDSVAVLIGHPDFVGQVIAMYYATGSFLSSFGLLWDVTMQPCIVTGLFNDKPDISLMAMITLMGHVSGDVNNDGIRDISDLVAVVDHFFGAGSMPEQPDAIDLDRNGLIDITDLVLLVEMMFGGDDPDPIYLRLIRN